MNNNLWKIALTLLCTYALSSHAADIKVLTAGAFKPVVMALAPEFEKQSGNKLHVENDTAGALSKRINSGESFDVVVLTASGLESLSQSGKVIPGTVKPLARVAIGVAVKEGMPPPDISSVSSFKQTLLDARSIAYIDPAAGGSSGIYLSKLFDKMGIAQQIQSKSVLVPGGLVAQRVVNGDADIAIHQISEILAVPGAKLVGPLPQEIQNYTIYAGGISAQSGNLSAAKAFLELLGSANAKAVFMKKGMEAP